MAEKKKLTIEVIDEKKKVQVECQGCGGITQIFQDGDGYGFEFFPPEGKPKVTEKTSNFLDEIFDLNK